MGEADEQRGNSEIGTCHVCGEEFASQEDLSKHLMEAHQEELFSQREDEA
jgi:hypothetical protein